MEFVFLFVFIIGNGKWRKIWLGKTILTLPRDITFDVNSKNIVLKCKI